MFYESQSSEQKFYYGKMLNALGGLSKLFSESPSPYLGYRLVENLFCRSFSAENLSRSDASADASKNKIGIGIKTFLDKNGKNLEKVAEFNAEHHLFSNLSPENKIVKISELRNERIASTKRIFELDDIIYHCVTRNPGKILVYETGMDPVNIEKINLKEAGKNTITFEDGIHEYSFNITKSTLYRRFITENVSLQVPVRIIDDPFAAIEKMFLELAPALNFASLREQPHIFLPLYSSRGGNKKVPEKSGLNQWNASGRSRNPNEVYIPIPIWIHRKFPGFFPPQDISFNLLIPNKKQLSAKVCQENGKALMTNPNSALGEWLLRDVMNLKEGELLNYESLEKMGLDSVVIYKIDNQHYDIDFTRIGSYEAFATENDGDATEISE